MNKKAVAGMILAVLTTSMLPLTLNIQSLGAGVGIIISSNGDIYNTDKIRRDGNVYTFTDEIEDSITVMRSNSVIDGGGHVLKGKGTASGPGMFLMGVENVAVRNVEITTFDIGLYLYQSSVCNISGTNATENFQWGIFLDGSPNNSISGNNILTNVVGGIYLNASSNNNISRNNQANQPYGIFQDGCSHNTLSENNITENYYSFLLRLCNYTDISGNNVANSVDRVATGIRILNASYYSSIVENNITNNYCGITVDASYNSSIVENNITNNNYGIDVDASYNSSIVENNITNNYCGITVDASYYSSAVENSITNNNYGIDLSNSNYSSAVENSITNNEYGILFFNSSYYNIIDGNDIISNSRAIWFYNCSSYNSVSENVISSNKEDGIYLTYSTYCNSIVGNNITNNHHGINLWISSNNSISRNNILLNKEDGIYLNASSYNNISRNNIGYNRYGVWAEVTSEKSWIYRNNFVSNEVKNSVAANYSANFWDKGAPEGGNYWSDYEGEDRNNDGFGNSLTPHCGDSYPLIVPEGPIPIIWKETEHYCNIVGNLTVSRFCLSPSKEICFNITGGGFNTTGHGYVNLTISRELLDGSLQILVNNVQTPYLSNWTVTTKLLTIHFEHGPTPIPLSVKIEAEFPLIGDINSDGKVNIIDIAIVAKYFGEKLP